METDRPSLEAALLEDPFALDLRLRYARLLLGEGDATRAAQQLDLVLKQERRADAKILRALCALALGEREQAELIYREARALPGFEPSPELDSALAQRAPARTPLAVFEGGRPTVVALPVVRKERVGFADVGGMTELKKTLRMQIIEPFLRPSLFARFKKAAGGGIMLYGPPGCGKTLIARAIATECGATFVHVGISQILNLWLGESERNLAGVFEEARRNRPAVLFFDEIDALAFSRSKSRSDTMRTIVNEFLGQLDGFDRDNREVLVLAATNMPWDVDPAMKRPGRFSRLIFVPPPDQEARLAILQMKLADIPTQDLDLPEIARASESFSGADLDAVIDHAKDRALEEALSGRAERPLNQDDLRYGLDRTVPSTHEWLRTVGNLVRYAGEDPSYRDVEAYIRKHKF